MVFEASMVCQNIYQDYNLYVFSKEFIIDPLENDSEFLVIDRISNEISLKKGTKHLPPSADSVLKIYGILGTIHLLSGNYLLVITGRTLIGEISGNKIWQADTYEILPYCKSFFHLTEQKVQDNKVYVSMLKHMLRLGRFYFSTSYDLSHTFQSINQLGFDPEFREKCFFDRAEKRFVWNSCLMQELAPKPELDRYKLPIICGFVSINPFTPAGSGSATGPGDTLLSFALVSRRSIHRAGVRYYCRGLDEEGHPANYIETEQILEQLRSRPNGPTGLEIVAWASYVQTRGSVPLFWTQEPNLKYKPFPVISQTHDQLTGFMKHMTRQIHHYGKQVIINLLDDCGAEGDLSKAFQKMAQNGSSDLIKYFQFDFHRECANMQYHKLDKLITAISDEQDAIGYYLRVPSKGLESNQAGVFRTNCVDCLDRTNVIQSLLARRILDQILWVMGLIPNEKYLHDYPTLYQLFKNVWTENANVCSWQYAGSGALKTDFTRTGKRTKIGVIHDGLNSALRYYKNNFVDGFSQDSIDLFLGKFVVDKTNEFPYVSPFRSDYRDWKYIGMPIVFVISFAMIIVTFLIPPALYTDRLTYYAFWGVLCFGSMVLIYANGPIFVDKPRLMSAKIKNE